MNHVVTTDIPTTPHLALIVEARKMGCGYDCDDMDYLDYETFDAEAAWIKRMEELAERHIPFRPIYVNPVDVQITVTVKAGVKEDKPDGKDEK